MDTRPVSKGVFWGGWIMGILSCLMLLMSGAMKFVRPPGFEESVAQLGWDKVNMLYLGAVELACAALYLIPQTSVLGAILLTAYLGGAVATHVRIGDNFITPIIIGIVLWGGLFLRDPRIRALIPFRS
jgi:hypothetical protein